jgi:hypothetical protein
MKRTTVALDERLLRDLKATAAKRGITLAALVNELLRQALAAKPGRGEYKFKFGGWKSELQPGVDICDRNKLFDLLDGR